MSSDTHRTIRKGLLIVSIAAIVLAVFAGGSRGDDFLVYWSGARLLARGENPYDLLALGAVQHQARPERGQEQGGVLASWNPPWLLAVLMPFGLMPFELAVRVWKLCNIGLTLAAALLTWRVLMQSLDGRGMVIASMASLWFFPTILSLGLGQISSLVLIGLVLGVWWLGSGRDGLAGAALFLTTVKPHLVYFVLLLVVVWAIRRGRWRLFGGMLGAALISMATLWVMFPGWMAAYFELISGHSFVQYSTSTLGSLVYALFGTHLFRYAGLVLVLLIPAMLRLAESEGWLTAMNVALLISVPLAMYGYSFDQVVLLPAILEMIVWLWRRELAVRAAWVIGGGLVLVYVVMMAMQALPALYYHWYAWPPLVVAGLYALGRRQGAVAIEARDGVGK
jgi:hypothetical protein